MHLFGVRTDVVASAKLRFVNKRKYTITQNGVLLTPERPYGRSTFSMIYGPFFFVRRLCGRRGVSKTPFCIT